MGMFNTYPYTDMHELNLDWVISQLQDLKKVIADLNKEILEEAARYTDEQIEVKLANVQQAIDQVNQIAADIQRGNEEFRQLINLRLNLQDGRIDTLTEDVVRDIAAVNDRTDMAIAQNNEYILGELPKFLAMIRVVNYFTGQQTTVQDMFDYLAQFHLENAISINELIAANKTYTQYKNYNMTYTQLARNGKSIII